MSALRVLPLLSFSLLLLASEGRAQEGPSTVVGLPGPQAANDGKVVSERNVRIDVTVTVKGTDKTVAKSLSLVAADGKQVQGRAGVQLPIVMSTNTGANMPPPTVSYRDVGINVDASPRILPSGKVSVSMKLSFSNVLQVQAGGGERPSFGSGSQEVDGVVFDSGKPLVVLEGGDPETGRIYTVQVTATVLK